MIQFMAPCTSLPGVSLFSAVSPTFSNDTRQIQCPEKFNSSASSSGFFGCNFLAHPSWVNLKLRQKPCSSRTGVDGSLMLPFTVRPAAILCVSVQAGQTEFAEKEQKKVRRKRRSPRTKSESKTLDPSLKGTTRTTVNSAELPVLTTVDSSAEPSTSELVPAGNEKEHDKKLPSDLQQICWQSGDPLGKRLLGKSVVKWIACGIQALVKQVATAEEKGDTQEIEEIMKQAGLAFVAVAQPYLAENPMPLHQEALCLKASTHYPTLFDHFQRGLQEALQELQKTGAIANWQQSQAWKLLKKHAKSDGHRKSTRKSYEVRQGELGLTRDDMAVIQERIDKFVAHAFELLRIERDAELDATQHSLDSVPAGSAPLTPEELLLAEEDLHPESNDTIRNLIAVSSSTGLGGMHLVTLAAKGGERLPPSSMSPGDMVCVRVSDRKGAGATECMRGSVYSLGEDGTSIAVAVEARYGDPTFSRLFGRPLRIDRISDLADATTYQRDCEALDRLQKQGLQRKNPAISIVKTLFSEGLEIDWMKPADKIESPLPVILDGDFDESQRRAIEVALDKRRPVAIIQGPPGTGKTKVVVEIIMQAVAQGEKVLATAPTNAAVDNLVERLALAGVNVVRVGNPARVAPAVVAKSLSYIVESNISGFRRDLGRRRADLRSDLRQCLGDESMEVGIRQMLKQIGRQLKQKEKELVDETLNQAQVILCTNTGAGDSLVRHVGPFGLVVIDEAGQAIEPSCWIPLSLGKRAVLAGDSCQLAPTILSRQAMEGGLGVSLMERAADLHGGKLSTMLKTQYRMHKVIAEWSSQEMYKGRLKSSPSVKSRLLCHSPEVESTWITQVPLLLLDTRLAHGSLIAGCEECMDPAGTGSFYNEGEADIVMEHIRALLSAGVAAENIAVQSPYLAQVQLLRDRAEGIPGAQGVQIASVDSFQGREADAVIISMVRSNRLGVVGFLGDNRRMNVAITRARKHVAIICDSSTVSRNSFLRKLLQYIRHNGEVRCAFEGWSISGLLKSRLPSS
ncbi:hypothetical protein MPTK1_3g22970 [Marchantia polymorpha subsp. ruderalis]|uniref:Helicase ATP-binding domain-containing protein n=4 Tax=Marchantia polymorpha TaxID=3197 RepID=A0A176VK41_MARPO|nr:hypothetical protein AXG93_868s1320 [Marchantia polymorpha subsp. ruderalis]PTQ43559.1 hypothetical protein MARPO_0024s0074 [Marchantia polymorpha]BBN06661.1 hypothetical protein Mp_3g22970 [Marchantia polymorpha subsp. ruderalis]|eukprot:PTQ43559.1 hypothetical protein MARPO_0024s0074 [Marchantia polymorpha]